jgi:hypothetical protein
MSTVETEHGADSQYRPFTPFLESYAFEAEPPSHRFEEFEAAPIMTPFVSEYAGVETQTPEAVELRELLFELYDQEFDEVLADLAHEAWEAVTERASPLGESEPNGSAEQFLEEWSAPVREAAEQMLDNVAQAAGEHDVPSMSEAEFDQFFERFAPRDTGLEPYFEDFLGGLWKKVKNVAKKAVDVAKKGLTLLPGLSGLLSKLKALVRPLLNRVLRTAIDKLPTTLRPLARQLAQRVLGAAQVAEAQDEDFEAAPAAPDISAVQQQFDFEAAMLMFAADEIDQEVVISEASYADEQADGTGAAAELHEARARFVEELEAGADPEQAMEQFIPAVMAVLPIARTVIGVIGRKRVVGFLAKFLAAFISRYVPKEAASRLSMAIVDAGMRILSLETPVETEATGTRVASESIAQAVEDTVRRVAELDETVFEDPALLEAAVTEAFHEAAAENFPPSVIAPELHEATVNATWVVMPTGKHRKHYKKYSHIFDVEITPQMAETITSFGGTKLAQFLRDRLGVVAPVRARVHLYQAISGTTLKRIARLDRKVPGLGTARHGAIQLHPLTVQAAGTLLQQPKLGRDVPGAFVSSRRSVAVGARFYYLEIAGAKPITADRENGRRAAVRRSSEVNITLDFPQDEYRVVVFLSEGDAQEVAARIRNKDLTSTILLARRIYEPGIRSALAGDLRRHVRVLTEALPQEGLVGSPLKRLAELVRQRLTRKVSEWTGTAIADYMRTGSGEFVSVTESPADGVSIVITAKSPPGASLVRKLLRGEIVGVAAGGDLDSQLKGQPQLSARTVAGFHSD